MRYKWHINFFRHALITANMSKDPKAKVGAVVVDFDNRIVSTGYNGLPSGVDHNNIITKSREDRLACTIHAEENALAFAWRNVKGMCIYSTRYPCARCAAMICQRKLSCVHVLVDDQDTINPDWEHSFKLADNIFYQSFINVYKWKMEGDTFTPMKPIST